MNKLPPHSFAILIMIDGFFDIYVTTILVIAAPANHPIAAPPTAIAPVNAQYIVAFQNPFPEGNSPNPRAMQSAIAKPITPNRAAKTT